MKRVWKRAHLGEFGCVLTVTGTATGSADGPFVIAVDAPGPPQPRERYIGSLDAAKRYADGLSSRLHSCDASKCGPWRPASRGSN